jgi:hypothetical protein
VTGPSPPLDLAGRQPELVTLNRGVIIHRFYTRGDNYDPIYFDHSLGSRFNAPDGSYGTLYTARTIEGAFAESFLRKPGHRLIARDTLNSKGYARLHILRPLKLVRLAGPGLARVGATAEVVHGGLPYDLPQAWSAALRKHPVQPNGIAYYGRHDDETLCYALFSDGSTPVEVVERTTELDADWFWTLCERYHIGVAPEA